MGANFPFVSTAFFAFFPNAITIVRIFLFRPKWAYLMIKVHTKNLPQILGNDTQYASKLALNCNWAVCHVWCPPMNLLLSANSPLLLSYLPAPKVFCGRLMIATRKSTSKVCRVFFPFSVWARTTWALGRTFVTFPSSFFLYCSLRIESGKTRITLLLPLPNFFFLVLPTNVR